ncbi:hypothetical protein AAY473_017733 [Plecturocebus cupreus]
MAILTVPFTLQMHPDEFNDNRQGLTLLLRLECGSTIIAHYNFDLFDSTAPAEEKTRLPCQFKSRVRSGCWDGLSSRPISGAFSRVVYPARAMGEVESLPKLLPIQGPVAGRRTSWRAFLSCYLGLENAREVCQNHVPGCRAARCPAGLGCTSPLPASFLWPTTALLGSAPRAGLFPAGNEQNGEEGAHYFHPTGSCRFWSQR